MHPSVYRDYFVFTNPSYKIIIYKQTKKSLILKFKSVFIIGFAVLVLTFYAKMRRL